jgi:hypothetical protein
MMLAPAPAVMTSCNRADAVVLQDRLNIAVASPNRAYPSLPRVKRQGELKCDAGRFT